MCIVAEKVGQGRRSRRGKIIRRMAVLCHRGVGGAAAMVGGGWRVGVVIVIVSCESEPVVSVRSVSVRHTNSPVS